MGAGKGVKKKINKISTFIGISSGSIICFLLSIGYTPYEIFISLLKYDNLLTINLDKLYSGEIRNEGGLFSSENIFKHLETQMRLKEISRSITFKEHFEKTGKILIVMAFNITKCKEDIFMYETTPDMEILNSLKLSARIPIIFGPIKYNNDFYIDGGVWNNFPIDIAIKYHKKKSDWIIAITTLFSTYKQNIHQWYKFSNINIVMVNDTPDLNPSLVSSDLEKLTMFNKGEEKASLIKKQNIRRNSI